GNAHLMRSRRVYGRSLVGVAVDEWLPVVPQSPLVKALFGGVVARIGEMREQHILSVVPNLGKSLYRVEYVQVLLLLFLGVAVHRVAGIVIPRDEVHGCTGV